MRTIRNKLVRYILFLSLFTTSFAAWAATPMVAAGMMHTLGLTADGTVVAWGANDSGQLGDGTTYYRARPVVVPGLTGVSQIAAGGFHTVALKSDGSLVAWGFNYHGQLGDGTQIDRLSPVPVPGLNGVVALAAGALYTVALTTDDTVWGWGCNSELELGLGYQSTRMMLPMATLGVGSVGVLNLYSVMP